MMEPLPPVTVHLLDLFQGPLRDVRFPDADGERLSAAVDATTTAMEALARAEAAVQAARLVLGDKQRIVAQETERTLAYARIYAADRPELRAALDASPTRNRAPSGRGPGRSRKTAIPANPKLGVADATDASAAEAAAE